MKKYNYFNNNKLQITGIIHVGAHRGEEIYEYQQMGIQQVIWIKPNPDVFKELVDNLNTIQTTISSYLIQKAISDQDDQISDFYICYDSDAGYMVGNKGCSSLLLPKGRFESWLRDVIKVKTLTLDTLFERYKLNINNFQLLNMDVQGAELLVLKGALRVLDHIKYIFTEVTWNNPDYIGNVMQNQLIEFLDKRGFKHIETYKHSPDWEDALFIKNV